MWGQKNERSAAGSLQIWTFHVIIWQTTSKNCTKKRAARLFQVVVWQTTSKFAPKSVPHVQHDYFSSFSQLNHCFVALSWSCPNSVKFPFAFSVVATPWSGRAILSNWINLFLSLLGRGSQRRYQTTLDLRCNIYADVGNPGPGNNRNGSYFKFPCEYYLVWESLYACPKCQGHEVEKVVGECINGTRKVAFVRSVHCWGCLLYTSPSPRDA